jgi:hypothetical protein
MTATNPYYTALAPLASGFLPGSASAGDKAQAITGAVAVSDGTGGWTVTLNTPYADQDIIIQPSPTRGTNIPGGVTFGIAAGASAGIFDIDMYKQSDGSKLNLAIYFVVWHRAKST